MTEATFTLPDGRLLGYAQFGPADARPVLYFHGTPGSRLEPGLLKAYGIDTELLLQQYNLRLITVDRPGMGLSTFNKRSTLLSFAGDAAALANALQLQTSPVLCWSGGGPYALAIAAKFPLLIPAVYIMCGFTRRFVPEVVDKMHLNKWYFQTARHAPWLLRSIMNKIRHHNPNRPLPQKLIGLPDADYELMKTPEQLTNMMVHSLREACRNGAGGPVHDAGVYFKEFGFKLSDIKQPVHYWWGTADNNVINLHPDAIAQHIQNDHLHLKKGEGHISLYVRYFEEAIRTIAAEYPNSAS